MSLILASGSATRASLLRQAGVPFEQLRPPLDEEAEKARLRAQNLAPEAQALALSAAKALSVEAPGAWVLGADQMLSCEGAAFDKPADRAAARRQLQALRGRSHTLETGAALAHNGQIVWSALARPCLRMRDFSDAFLDSYLDTLGEQALHSVGAYQAEGLGVQLFEAIEGEWYAVLGLPLLALLARLREAGLLTA